MLSEKELDLLRQELIRDEGYQLKAYRDTKGIVSIGIGWNCQANNTIPLIGRKIDQVGESITNDECLKLFKWSVDNVGIKPLLKYLPDIYNSLSDVRKRALINLCFNMGIDTLLKFKPTLEHMRLGQFDDVAYHLERSLWYRQVGNRAKRIVHMFKYNNTDFPSNYATNFSSKKKKK